MHNYLLTIGLMMFASFANAQGTIDQIESLPRTNRIRAYESVLTNRQLAVGQRLAIVPRFALHARLLSPNYSKGRFPFSASGWLKLFDSAVAQGLRDENLLAARAQMLIDSMQFEAALSAAEDYRKAYPDSHEAMAWHEWASRATSKGLIKEEIDFQRGEFKVHFCILSANPESHVVATKQQCEREVEILNSTFRSTEGMQLAVFKFSGFTDYHAAKETQSDLLAFGDRQEAYDTDTVAEAFNRSNHVTVRDRGAINVYVVDSYSPKEGFADMTSHGKRNSNRPFVLLDWQRLNNNVQNAEAHEMGHAFGLGHVGVPFATVRTSTNIMTSAAEEFGSGGLRDLGFTPSQTALILYHGRRTRDRLGN
ncbi:hypothetical protein Pla100_34880 [Neorhodopirellula pilleata]|uniref:Peptidase M10 metallopeptidase domain-containing protein n=2 Tax=Neorhodopirellula pilleata TaxID=2714738 RepID=A0A5C6A6A8_9BACT|nr:hypothetical protein Pla100_34880 [Neorhodopirellula pilleata]